MSTLSERLRTGVDDPGIFDEAADELDRLTAQAEQDFALLRWAYSKLVYRSFDNMEDALVMDEIKLMLLDDQRARRTGG